MGRSKSGLFLMELIIAIAFFAVSSAICIQLFALAHSLSARSIATQMAVINAQTAAETFKVAAGDMDYFARLLQADLVSDSIVANFDSNWTRTTVAENVQYSMFVYQNIVNNMATAIITISNRTDGTEVYSLTVNKYLGLGVN
ncbi:MAG: hypothetical protein FWG68_08030 [Defluviitaleaceae bacterium]|nr:hypothetical protein [Defluviitaleaceae bacterium]